MNSEDNKFNDTARNTNPQGNSHTGHTENKGTEPPKDEKPNTKEQIGKVVDNMKPYAEKAWAVTKDLADFVKEKAPDIMEALKKDFKNQKRRCKMPMISFKSIEKKNLIMQLLIAQKLIKPIQVLQEPTPIQHLLIQELTRIQQLKRIPHLNIMHLTRIINLKITKQRQRSNTGDYACIALLLPSLIRLPGKEEAWHKLTILIST